MKPRGDNDSQTIELLDSPLIGTEKVKIMNKIVAFLKKEFLEMLPPTIFFFVVFQLVVISRSVLGAELNISMVTSAAAAIAALIVGKSILVADALPPFRWFRDNRLIYNVVWRTALYMSIIIIFQVLEEFIPLISKYGGFASASEHFIADVDGLRFWATHMILVVFLIFYSFATALINVVGIDRFFAVFFGWTKRV